MVQPVGEHVVLNHEVLNLPSGFVRQCIVASEVRMGRQLSGQIENPLPAPFRKLHQKIGRTFGKYGTVSGLTHA